MTSPIFGAKNPSLFGPSARVAGAALLQLLKEAAQFGRPMDWAGVQLMEILWTIKVEILRPHYPHCIVYLVYLCLLIVHSML